VIGAACNNRAATHANIAATGRIFSLGKGRAETLPDSA
jgi:hypothetical protein